MKEDPAGQLAQHLPRMYRVALRIVGDADGTEDVAQEACARALAGMGKFNGGASMATWLYRITVNCAVDHVRAASRAGAAEAQIAISQARAPQQSPAAMAQDNELARRALQLVESLPEDCRVSFILTQLVGRQDPRQVQEPAGADNGH
ncbi:MAG: RNA polymerase sigma factor [Phycisphaerae bacterium]